MKLQYSRQIFQKSSNRTARGSQDLYLNFGVSADDQLLTSSYQLPIAVAHSTSGPTLFQNCAMFCPTLKSSADETSLYKQVHKGR